MVVLPISFSPFKWISNNNCNIKSFDDTSFRNKTKLENSSAININQNIYYLPKNLSKYNVNFKADSSIMMNEYSKNQGSILDYLKKSTNSSENTFAFLNELTKDKSLSFKFIDELISDPSKSAENVKLIESKLGSKKLFLQWYFSKDGYVQAYEKYLKDSYLSAKSIEELLKIQPNWGYWSLERKTCALSNNSQNCDNLMRERKANFTVGQLPDSFGNKYRYKSLINNIKTLDFGVNDKDLYISDGRINVSQLPGGDLSSKNIYLVKTADNKKYIIKMDRFYPEDILNNFDNQYVPRTAKENKLIRGDSVYMDACIDYYLQSNGCENNAKLHYYDFETDSAIYEFVDIQKYKQTNSEEYIPQVQLNKSLKPIRDLGVYPVDIGYDINYSIDSNNNVKIPDLGHSEYIDLLKPGARLLTIDTPNLCGFSFKNSLAGLGALDLDFEDNQSKDFSDSSATAINNMSKTATTITNGDPTYFFSHKNEVKLILKEVLRQSKLLYPKDSPELANAHFNMIDFYFKDISCRINYKIGDASEDKINGISNAIKREITELRSYPIKDNAISNRIMDYDESCNEIGNTIR